MRSCKWWSVFSNTLALSSLLFAAHAMAVVNVDRTRIIFNAGESSQALNIKNGADTPSVVQIWSDDGDLMQSPELSSAPIFAVPPMMKLAPDEQRAIRLVLTSRQSLPEDRESLYWLNIYQIPALSRQTGSAEQKIMLPLRLRLKVFIRPAALGVPQPEDVQKLRFIVHERQLTLKNPTAWYMSLRLQIANKLKVDDVLVAPFGSFTLPLTRPVQVGESVIYEVFDDNGNPVGYQSHTDT
ncbi:fimbrial assembly chaperone [Pantoea sp. JGM49]|uniref:fimbrial assembly chaperone n=1 Tax=Pantoea sp. JGM49 TaxID=2799791 RepID=UPI001BA44D00|nr:fimbrial assembly chaperone [Pantoea sp. JGM49]MBS0883278.1 fimbrial assembly chaperone [Pantoea sp. JGM49]